MNPFTYFIYTDVSRQESIDEVTFGDTQPEYVEEHNRYGGQRTPSKPCTFNLGSNRYGVVVN
ncbi:MAG TPA: hypothetical protein VFL67_00060 [Mycobacterium sp.]|nr:hypothetical protein [Mycobacterium sp.]